MIRSYAVVTPARDEAANLPRLAACLAGQTVTPTAWIVVENGSSDGTPDVVRSLGLEHPWIRMTATEAGPPRERGVGVVRALEAGVAAVPDQVDAVLFVDADVAFDPAYAERLLAELSDDPRLGIVSGSGFEEEDGAWRRRHVTGGHVWGAARAYRRACLDDVRPLVERTGWDAIDVAKAATRGWHTTTLLDLPFRHYRPEGLRDGNRRSVWAAQGELAHYMGYGLAYVAARAAFRALALREPAALSILTSYLRATRRREPRAEPELRAHVRSEHSLARLPLRAGEALGLRR